MSKYSEIFGHINQAFQDGEQYRYDCADFFKEMRKAIIEYLEVPEENIAWHNSEVEGTYNMVNLLGGMRLQEDGYYLNECKLTFGDDRILNKYNFIFTVAVKKIRIEDDAFFVKLPYSNSATEYKIAYPGVYSSWEEFLQAMFDHIVDYYQDGLNKFLSGGQYNPIGFKTSKIEE